MYSGLKIALIGHIRCGKDTVANIIMNKYGFRRFAIADNIKSISEELYPELIGSGKNRPVQQRVAAVLRKYDEDFWLRLLVKKIKNELSSEMNAVITDLRYPNEYTMFKEMGFIVLKINAPRETRLERMKVAGDIFREDDLNFTTESFIDEISFDCELSNDSSIKVLEENIIKLLPNVSSMSISRAAL